MELLCWLLLFLRWVVYTPKLKILVVTLKTKELVTCILSSLKVSRKNPTPLRVQDFV